jgi:hypothetical protein
MRYETVPDPIKVTACAICSSDLHIYNGVIPEMESGDVRRRAGLNDRLGAGNPAAASQDPEWSRPENEASAPGRERQTGQGI